MERPRHHADDGVGRAVQHDLAADDGGIAAEARLPEAVAQDDGPRGPLAVILGQEDAAEERRRAQQGKEVGGERGALQPLGIALAAEVGGERQHRPHRLEGRAHALPVAVVGGRQLHLAVPLCELGLPEPGQPLGLGEGQRADQHVVGEGEGGGGGPDPEGGHDDRGRREPARASERSRREAEVLPKDVEVDKESAGQNVWECLRPERDRGREAPRLAEAPREDGNHLPAVLVAERRGEEPQQREVGAHHALRGASPRARASSTRPARRRASARAAARPRLVMR